MILPREVIRVINPLSKPRSAACVLTVALVAVLVFVFPVKSARAEASIFTQDLTRCITKSVSAGDKIGLARWMMGAMSRHPALKDIAVVSADETVKLNKQMASIVQRLLTENCKKEAQDVAKYDRSGFFQSFSVLGSVAMSEIMTNPAVGQAVDDYGQYIDEARINETLGISPSPSAKKE